MLPLMLLLYRSSLGSFELIITTFFCLLFIIYASDCLLSVKAGLEGMDLKFNERCITAKRLRRRHILSGSLPFNYTDMLKEIKLHLSVLHSTSAQDPFFFSF